MRIKRFLRFFSLVSRRCLQLFLVGGPTRVTRSRVELVGRVPRSRFNSAHTTEINRGNAYKDDDVSCVGVTCAPEATKRMYE